MDALWSSGGVKVSPRTWTTGDGLGRNRRVGGARVSGDGGGKACHSSIRRWRPILWTNKFLQLRLHHFCWWSSSFSLLLWQHFQFLVSLRHSVHLPCCAASPNPLPQLVFTSAIVCCAGVFEPPPWGLETASVCWSSVCMSGRVPMTFVKDVIRSRHYTTICDQRSHRRTLTYGKRATNVQEKVSDGIPVLSSWHTNLRVGPFVRERQGGKFTFLNLRVGCSCMWRSMFGNRLWIIGPVISRSGWLSHLESPRQSYTQEF